MRDNNRRERERRSRQEEVELINDTMVMVASVALCEGFNPEGKFML